MLPKKDKDLLILSNWRPLTLLNVDYKMISKALSTRLKPILTYLIHEDQAGFLQNRNISHSIRNVLDVIQYTKSNKIQALMVSLDWEKAFDRVSRDSIDRTSHYFYFGPNFRSAIQTLFTNSRSCVVNNGHKTPFFDSLSGIKQGCNTSPLIFDIQEELLSILIRENSKIKGIPILEREHKITQFADDTNLFLKFEKETIMELENTLEAFEEATCMRINCDKTCVY